MPNTYYGHAFRNVQLEYLVAVQADSAKEAAQRIAEGYGRLIETSQRRADGWEFDSNAIGVWLLAPYASTPGPEERWLDEWAEVAHA